MLFNIPTGGKAKAVVSFCGAPGETITLIHRNGTTFTDIVLNEHGKSVGTYEIPTGSYIVEGSVSSEILTTGRAVEINKDTTVVTSYPPGAIFWFGNGDTDGDSLYIGDYVYTGGQVPDGKSGSNGYGSLSMEADYVGASCSCPSSSGSKYGGTTWSPLISVEGYSHINIYGYSRHSSRAGFGFPAEKATKWATDMYVSPDDSVYQLYSMAIPSGRTSGYLGASVFNCTSGSVSAYAYIKAAWRDTTNVLPMGELPTATNSINVGSETLRYGTSCASYWGAAQAYSDENYFGKKSEGYNIALLNLGSFTIPDGARPTKLRLSFYGYRSSQSNFCWAICTSNKNMTLYGKGGAIGVVGEFDGDDTQIAMGTKSLSGISTSSYSTMTFDFETDAIPSDTPLYMYLWPSDQGTQGVSHINRYLKATVYYTYEEA